MPPATVFGVDGDVVDGGFVADEPSGGERGEEQAVLLDEAHDAELVTDELLAVEGDAFEQGYILLRVEIGVAVENPVDKLFVVDGAVEEVGIDVVEITPVTFADTSAELDIQPDTAVGALEDFAVGLGLVAYLQVLVVVEFGENKRHDG